MYGVTKENEIKFMRHIVETNGNPSSKVAKECNLEGYFCELCCRHVPKEKMVEIVWKTLPEIAKYVEDNCLKEEEE